MHKVILIAHNVRSTHNVGALLRTADGLGVEAVYLTGYTPYPTVRDDTRPPHISASTTKKIRKTALGAEVHQRWHFFPNIFELLTALKEQGYKIVALEQHQDAVTLKECQPKDDIALIVGRETDGVEPEVLEMCDTIIEIPMRGVKESFNVSVAAAIALYHLKNSA